MNKLTRQLFSLTIILLIFSTLSTAQNGISPSNSSINSSNASAIYNNWKSTYVDTWTSNGEQYGRVKWQSGAFWDPCLDRSEGPNVTASEGIGYGMVLAAYNNDQNLLDRLLNFMELVIEINNPSHKLMPWLVWGIHDPNNGKFFGEPICEDDQARSGASPATDGDMDMAFALIKAEDNGWSRSGGDSYDQVARNILGILMDDFVDNCSVSSNSSTNEWIFAPYPFGGCNVSKRTHNLSYYAPGYFRVFADFMNEGNWDNLADATYSHINRLKSVRGGNLVPNFSKADGSISEDHGSSSSTNQNYHYDAARVPWRIAMDYVWNGTGAAQENFLDDVNYTFLGPITASQVGDGYRVQNGNSQFSYNNSPAFYGGFACGLMAQANNQYNRNKLNQFASQVKNTSSNSGYYNYTLTALYALLLSGDFDKPSISSGNNNNNNNNSGLADGNYRIKNVWTGMYLTGGGDNANNAAEVAELNAEREDWGSMKWDIRLVSGSSDEYWIQSNWGEYYLHNTGSSSGSEVQTRDFNDSDNAQKWVLEEVSGNIFRLKSQAGGKYLNAGNTEWNDAQTLNLDNSWGSMQWILEYQEPLVLRESESQPSTDVSIFPNPSSGLVYISNSEVEEVRLIGIEGKRIGKFAVNEGRIDLSGVSAGMYFMIIDGVAKTFIKSGI